MGSGGRVDPSEGLAERSRLRRERLVAHRASGHEDARVLRKVLERRRRE